MLKEVDEVASTYAKINILFNDDFLHDVLHQECMFSEYKVAAGAAYVKGEEDLFDLN